MRRPLFLTLAICCLTSAAFAPAATDPATRPAPATRSASAAPSRRTIQFQFKGISYADAVRWFAQNAGKPILGDIPVTGELTFHDSKPYSYDDAFDTLNLLLAIKGYWLVETDRYFRVLPVAQVPNETKILQGLAEMDELRPGEVVTVVVPLEQMDSDTASKAVVRMVSTWGSISPLSKGRGIVITDSAKNIARVREFLKMLDAKSVADTVIESCQLNRANARVVADIVGRLFAGAQRRSYQRTREGRFELVRQDAGDDTVSATADDRTNSVILMGRSDRVAMAKEVITKLDAGEGEEAGDFRVFKLQNAKAEELAKVLLEAVGGSSRSSSSSSRGSRSTSSSGTSAKPVRIVPDPATNRMIVSAPADKMVSIEKLILELDTASTATGSARIVRLKSSDAQQLAEIVKNVLTTRGSYGRPSSGVQIAADPRTNSLILNGSAGEVQTAAELIEDLDAKDATDSREIHVIQLKSGSASRIADSLQDLFSREVAGAYGSRRSESILRVEADSSSNTLMISAPAAEWPRVQKLLQQITAAAEALPTAVVKRYPLKNAKAADLAETLREVHGESSSSRSDSSYSSRYSSYSSRYRSSSRSATDVPVKIAADRNANTLIVSASREDHAAIAEMITALDVAPAGGEAVRIITLQSAHAEKLAQTLKAVLPRSESGRAADVTIEADAATNTLLIRAPERRRETLEKLIAALDKQTQANASETRTFQLKHVRAADVVEVLRQMLGDEGSSRRSTSYSRYSSYSPYSSSSSSRASSSSRSVRVAALSESNAVVVQGPPARLEQAEQLIARLDVEDPSTRKQVRVYQIGSANAVDIVDALRRVFSSSRSEYGSSRSRSAADTGPQFDSDTPTNQVIVAATESQFVEIEEVIEKLQKGTRLASQTRTFPLKFAKADDIAEMLTSMLAASGASSAQTPWWARRRSGSTGPSVKVAAMSYANAVVVQAPPEKMLLAEQLIKQFDTQDSDRRIVIEIVRLENAQASSLADAVNAALSARRASTSRYGTSAAYGSATASRASPDAQVRVTAETNSNSILVRGPAGEVKGVVDMIRRLDEQGTSTRTQVRIFKLEHSSAADLAASVGGLLKDILGQRTGRAGYGARSADAVPFSIAADERTNSLVVSTTPANFLIVQEILAQLDTAGAPRDVAYFYLERADATEVVTTLDAMYAERPEAARPLIQADLFGSVVSVVAKEADLKAIEKTIAKLDEATLADQQPIIRIVPLTQIRASTMAELIQKMYGQMGKAEIIITDKLPERDANAVDANSIRIFPPPPDSLDMIYTQFEIPPMLGATTQPVDAATRPAARPAAAADANQPSQPGPDQRAKVTIAVDRVSNSLVILAPRQELDNIQFLIDQLSASASGAEMELRVIHVEYASPSAIADTLDALFNPKQRGRTPSRTEVIEALRGRAGRFGRPEQETQTPAPTPAAAPTPITVVADIRTRNIIVRARPSDFDVILPLVKELDKVSTVVSEVKIFTLKNTDATEVAANLIELFSPKRASAPRSPMSRSNSRSRSRSGSMSREQQAEMILQMLQMSEAGVPGATKVDSSSLVGISANRSTNSVVVSAPVEAMKLIERVIEQLDQSTSYSRSVKMYTLKHAEVAETVQALREIFADAPRGRTSRPTAGASRGGIDEPIIITGSEAGRMVLISAPDEKHELVAGVIRDLDSAQAVGEVTVKVYRLETADATTVSAALVGAMRSATAAPSRRGRGSSGGSAQLRITADRSSNSLVIRASKDEHARIAELIAQLDTAQADRHPVRTIALKSADADSVARVLGGLFGGAASSGRTARGRTRSVRTPGAGASSVVIEPDAPSRMILVRADDETFAKIQEIVAKLDAPSAARAAPEILPLQYAKAVEVAPSLQAAFGQTGRQRGETAVNIVPEPLTNSLIVTAAPDDLDRVKALVARFDTKEAIGAVTQVLQLRSAVAADIAGVLSSAAAGGTGPTRSRSRATVQPGPGQKVIVSSEPSSNTVIVTGPAKEVLRLIGMAEQLDTAASSVASPTIKIYPIKNADIPTVVRALQQIFTSTRTYPSRSGGAYRRTTGGRGEPAVAIIGDEVGGRIIVSAAAERHPLIAKTIEQMDQTDPADEVVVKVYRIENADATTLAEALTVSLTNVAGGRSRRSSSDPKRLRIIPDSGSNTLVVRGTAEDHEQIAKLIGEMDVGAADKHPVQTIALKNANAADVAQILNSVFAGGASASRSSRYRRSSRGAPTGGGVVIEADAAARMLLVRADEPTFEKIRELATKLDTASTGSSVRTLIALAYADASSVAAAVGRAFAPQRGQRLAPEEMVTVVAESNSNSIIVTANEANLERVRQLVASLDTETDNKMTVKVYKLESANASAVASALTASLRASGRRGSAADQVRVTADWSSGSLVVRAPESEHPHIADLVKQIDASGADEFPVQMIPLSVADAASVAAMLNKVYGPASARGRGGSTNRPKTLIEADKDSRLIVVRADPNTFQEIRTLAAKLDVPTGLAAQTLIGLKHAKAELAAASLNQAFAPQRGQRLAPEEVVSVVAEPGTNSLIVTANEPNLQRVKALLEQLDVASAGMRTQLLLLKNAKASDLATVLSQSAAAAGGGRPRGRGAPGAQGVTITAENASNALVITGPVGRIDEVIQMASELDKASEQTSTTVRVIQLTNGDATSVAAMVRELYAQQERAARAARQTLPPLAVTADERANALVVSANAEMHETVGAWITEIETMQPARGTVRIIQLKNVEPAEVDKAIQQLYNGGSQTPSRAPSRRGASSRAPRSGAAAGAGGRVETSVLEQQRSILISASDEDYKAIIDLARAMDEAAAAAKKTVRVFVLKNANNTRVAAALTAMYRAAAVRGAPPRPEDQVSITALPMTNAVVVSAAREKMAEVEGLIKQLDMNEVAPPLEFRVYTLENEMPSKILPALQQLLTQIRRLNPQETIDVRADERTRSIIVTAKGTLFDQIEKMIRALDRPPTHAGADVMVIPLKRADATRLAAVLMDMIRPSAASQVTPEARALQDQIRLLRLRGGEDANLPQLDLSKPIKITADPQAANQQGSNALVMVSTPGNLRALAAIVEILDSVPIAEAAKVRLIRLANADAATVAKVLVDVFAQGQKLSGAARSSVAGRAVPESASGKALVRPLNVSADARTNTLVLSGVEESLALAELIVTKLDVKDAVAIHEVRLVTLENADAAALAPILQKMLDARVQRAAVLGQLDSERLRMIVAADTRSNSLIVGGSADGFELVKRIATQVDTAGPALGGEIQLFPLTHANAGTLSSTLTNLFDARYQTARTPDVARQKPIIVPDLRINSLLISASADDSKVLAGLIRRLDVELTDPSVVIEVLPLTHNDAGAIGPTIQRLFAARLTSMTPPGATPSPQDRVDVAADALANALIVSASKENLALIRGLLAKVDVEPASETGAVKIYQLKNADAQRVATMLQGLVRQGIYKPGASFAAQNNPAVRAREQVAISFDARTNTLIVSASKENLAVLDEIVRGLDGDQVSPIAEFRVFKLTHATATAIAPTLQQLFAQRVTRETSRDPMTVIADPRSNSLIVGASATDMKLAEKLIAQLDVGQGGDSAMVAFPLEKADATQVANTLRTLLTSQGGGAAGNGAVNISVDERTNTVLASAGAADLQRIRELIEQLDREQVTRVTEIRVFPLQHADATELSQILTNLLTSKPASPVPLSPNRQTLLQFISKTEDGRSLVATALQEGVLIAPDTRSNALVVAAPVKNMPLLESLVRSLDSISPRMAEIRVFSLTNADAARMAEVLTQLFRLQGGPATKAVSYTLVTSQPAAKSEKGPSATVGSSEQDALSVTVDLRTNSLLIGGTRRCVALASKVIEELDSSPAQERVTKIYRLRNAQASAIQAAMQSFLEQEKQRLTSTLGSESLGAAQRLLEREVAVVAEETSNVLLLSASPRYFSTIETLIGELDQPPPQVLIQVLLAEVKLDETTELGIDWNVTSSWSDGADSVGAGTEIALAAEGEGFNLSVSAGDLSFFLRALQSQGRLEVLSRPQILASDNQQATINVGQRVPFITNSRVTDNGTTINTIEYQNVGIILTVTPRINPDGFVKLEVKPEISSIASSSVNISETTNAVVINERSAETTVSVQDGHTIIIGGLITTNDDDRDTQVPWFGELPWLGPLFRGRKNIKERSELLIILTPHVVRDIDTADRTTDKQLERVNLIRQLRRDEIEDYLKKHLDEILSRRSGQGTETGPTTRPASRILSRPASSDVPAAPVRTFHPPRPAGKGGQSPTPIRLPRGMERQAVGAEDASFRKAQERFLAIIGADPAKAGEVR